MKNSDRIRSYFVIYGILLLQMTLLCLVIESLFGPQGFYICLYLLVFLLMLGSSLSPHTVMRLFGGRTFQGPAAIRLKHYLSILSRRAGLDHAPELYLIPSDSINAMAAGRADSDSAIAVTHGMLRQLDEEETIAVLGHELGHICSNDQEYLGMASRISQLILIISTAGQFLLFLFFPFVLLGLAQFSLFSMLLFVFAPWAVLALQKYLSRQREYEADHFSAEITGHPEWLASALARMDQLNYGPFRRFFFMYKGNSGWIDSHPSTSERIEHLLGRKVAAARQPRVNYAN